MWIRWSDFWLPADRQACIRALAEALDRAGRERVDFACPGGRGRTGTAMAAVAVLDGLAPAEAVEWVRATYHPRAVETWWQRRWLTTVAG